MAQVNQDSFRGKPDQPFNFPWYDSTLVHFQMTTRWFFLARGGATFILTVFVLAAINRSGKVGHFGVTWSRVHRFNVL